jgi:hypothetical protein
VGGQKRTRKDDDRGFIGMNPEIFEGEGREKVLLFDSKFESGNLDMAIKIKDNEYDLYMRVDSNTRGHH